MQMWLFAMQFLHLIDPLYLKGLFSMEENLKICWFPHLTRDFVPLNSQVRTGHIKMLVASLAGHAPRSGEGVWCPGMLVPSLIPRLVFRLILFSAYAIN
jgi:hypothetical protein